MRRLSPIPYFAAVSPPASPLVAAGGLEGDHEFDVGGVAGKLAFGDDVVAVGVEEAGFLVDASAVPFVFVGAVEKDDGVRWR